MQVHLKGKSTRCCIMQSEILKINKVFFEMWLNLWKYLVFTCNSHYLNPECKFELSYSTSIIFYSWYEHNMISNLNFSFHYNQNFTLDVQVKISLYKTIETVYQDIETRIRLDELRNLRVKIKLKWVRCQNRDRKQPSMKIILLHKINSLWFSLFCIVL